MRRRLAEPAPVRLSGAVLGLSVETHRNAITELRGILRLLGLLEPYVTPPVTQGGRWAARLAMLQGDKHCLLGLGRFASWCDRAGIQPEDVTAETLKHFEGFMRTRLLIDDIPGRMRAVSKSWRKATTLAAEWPQVRLRAERRRQPYTLAFDAYPASLQADLARFETRLSGQDARGPFRQVGRRRKLRPATVKARLFSIRQALAALVHLGRDPTTITGLADLVEEKALEEILTFYWERTVRAKIERGEHSPDATPEPEVGVSAQTGGIAITLMIVAKHHCQLEPDRIETLKSLANDLIPDQQNRITPKNLERLRQFDDPAKRLALLHLPARLIERADRMEHAVPAAKLARLAVAIAVELHVPLRVKNLSELRLGQNLKFHDTRGGRITHMVLAAHETKNRNDCTWSVEPDLADFVAHYLKRHWPALAPAGGEWLFPSGPTKSGPLTAERLGGAITDIIAEEVGAVMNPHLFRAFTARLVLESNPGALEDARQLLGDKSLATVMAHYALIEPAAAARRHDARLRRLRQGGGENVMSKRRTRGTGARR